MLLKEKLSTIRKAGVKVSEQIKTLENNIVQEEVRNITLPLSLGNLKNIHNNLRDYQSMLIINDGYQDLEELKKIGQVANTVLNLEFDLLDLD